jgi:cytochrome c oxidase assembly protein subunit 15
MKPVRLWLWLVAVTVFCMVIVGGATRLTDSGLSITEWQPLLGIFPPLSEAGWLAEFEKYKAIPEYQTINRGMTLGEFKAIYWWEWAHRFLGRMIGLLFALPFLVFLALKKLDRKLTLRLLAILLLGAAQGVLGWFMVMSGLEERVDVSQYRLTAHLLLASLIFAATIWTVLGIGKTRAWQAQDGFRGAFILVLLIFFQIAAGGFVAGLDAGMGYNTWPKMDGAWIPRGLWVMDPVWRNVFENALTVQFNHRIIAYLIFIAAVFHAFRSFSMSAMIVAYAIFIQIGLGVFTVVLQVPISLGLAHQGGAMVVLALALWHLHRKSLVRTGEL